MRAAEYVRMSTEHQKYSTENQLEAIAAYAAPRGFEIVKTYADAGNSGLKLDLHAALQGLIADVRNGVADFDTAPVYDVSGCLGTRRSFRGLGRRGRAGASSGRASVEEKGEAARLASPPAERPPSGGNGTKGPSDYSPPMTVEPPSTTSVWPVT